MLHNRIRGAPRMGRLMETAGAVDSLHVTLAQPTSFVPSLV